MYIFIVIEISNLIKVVISPLFVSRSSDLMMAVLLYPKHVALSLMDIQYVVLTWLKHLLHHDIANKF